MPRIVDISSGDAHVLALTAEGTVFAWGNGQTGQLGIGNMPVISVRGGYRIQRRTAVSGRVPGLDGVTAIAASAKHSLALLKDGTLRAWGENRYGELGDGTLTLRNTPVTVRGVANAIAIAVNAGNSLAVLADGSVMSWGNGGGALGHPTTDRQPIDPGARSGCNWRDRYSVIRAPYEHGPRDWLGDENGGQVGHATPGRAGLVPTITTARAVHATGLTSFAILGDGVIMVWGMLPSLSFRTDGADSEAAHFPVPLIIKGL